MHAVIFTGGEFTISNFAKNVIQSADCITAADSGANTALSHNVFPSVVVGDLDSIDTGVKNILEEKGSIFVTAHSAKDETDTELAVFYAIQKGATKITLLGGIEGDRFDHIISNLLLATKSNVPIQFINGYQVSQIYEGPQNVHIEGNIHDLLSLVPLSAEVTHIKTHGLLYPLRDESLFWHKSRGVSNVFTEKLVSIEFVKGVLLVVQTINSIYP